MIVKTSEVKTTRLPHHPRVTRSGQAVVHTPVEFEPA